MAQDTIKVKRSDRGDEYCWVNVYTHKKKYNDTIPILVLIGDSKVELRMNNDCPALKKNDVFVTSFELEVNYKGIRQTARAESSFLTDQQKKILQPLGPGDSFTIKNIVLHAPDAFRKMEDLKIIVN